MALAELCFNTLMDEGVKAKIALEAGVCTPAVEKVIEANTLLSGIGFESAGLAGAHAIHNGFTVLEECHHMYHGEKVAFGTLTQLVLENVPEEELEDPVDFFTSLLVSFAMVIRPTEPSLARPLLLWKLLTALSVLSPKYPVTLEEDKYPYLLSRFWTCLTLSP